MMVEGVDEEALLSMISKGTCNDECGDSLVGKQTQEEGSSLEGLLFAAFVDTGLLIAAFGDMACAGDDGKSTPVSSVTLEPVVFMRCLVLGSASGASMATLEPVVFIHCSVLGSTSGASMVTPAASLPSKVLCTSVGVAVTEVDVLTGSLLRSNQGS